MKHRTDEHLVERGSSVDLIERCAAFIRQCGDFEGVLDYGEEEDEEGNLLHEGKFQEMLSQLEKEALRIITKESR